MATSNRRTTTRLTVKGNKMADLLLEEPWNYSFFQAVRMLQQRYGQGRRIGDVGEFAKEIIRFKPDTALSFAAADVVAISPLGEIDAGPMCFEVKVAFLGLYGVTSPLPSFYSEEILWNENADEKDLAKEFLDLVHHRLISLLYRAWEKYRYPIQFSETPHDIVTTRMVGLVGLAIPEVRKQSGLPSTQWLRFAGLLSQQPRSASGLESVLRHWLKIPTVTVRQCTGGWVDIHYSQQIQLGKKNNQLGKTTIVGRQILSPASSIAIHMGPVSFPTLHRFLPHGESFHRLVAIIRFYLKDWIDPELIWEIDGVSIPSLTLGRAPIGSETRLGWNTWLRKEPIIEKKHVSFKAFNYSVWQQRADRANTVAA